MPVAAAAESDEKVNVGLSRRRNAPVNVERRWVFFHAVEYPHLQTRAMQRSDRSVHVTGGNDPRICDQQDMTAALALRDRAQFGERPSPKNNTCSRV